MPQAAGAVPLPARGTGCLFAGCAEPAYRSALLVHLELGEGHDALCTRVQQSYEGGVCDKHAPVLLKHLKRALGTRGLTTQTIRPCPRAIAPAR